MPIYETRPSVLVFGEPLLELSAIDGAQASLGLGGDTFNTSVYLSRAGVDVQYVTAIGDDALSHRVVEALESEGIGTDFVSIVPGKPVGLYAIEVDADGERSFTYWRSDSAFKSWFHSEKAGAALDAMTSASMLYLSGISLSALSDAERAHLVDVLASAHRGGVSVAFDTNYRPSGWRSPDEARAAIRAVQQYVSISLPTFEDEQDLFGLATPEACLASWRAVGCAEVCVKAGARGGLLNGGNWVSPATARKPIDTTGAGDSFNAGYLATRLQGGDAQAAAAAGNELAGRVIMTSGAILPRH